MEPSRLPSRIVLVDRNGPLARAWEHAFEDQREVEVHVGDFFDFPADAMVSPANSFGIMDGGLDHAIRDRLGFEVQRSAQAMILERYHGEMPVGAAEVVAADHAHWRYLIVAPTMRVPENVARTVHAYLAFRAVLLAVARFNARPEHRDAPIESVLCPGLGTGVGRLDPERCAVQMRMALLQVKAPARIASFGRIRDGHDALLGR